MGTTKTTATLCFITLLRSQCHGGDWGRVFVPKHTTIYSSHTWWEMLTKPDPHTPYICKSSETHLTKMPPYWSQHHYYGGGKVRSGDMPNYCIYSGLRHVSNFPVTVCQLIPTRSVFVSPAGPTPTRTTNAAAAPIQVSVTLESRGKVQDRKVVGFCCVFFFFSTYFQRVTAHKIQSEWKLCCSRYVNNPLKYSSLQFLLITTLVLSQKSGWP